MAELLIELRSEEIPARMQTSGIERMIGEAKTWLKEQSLDASIEGFVTPRRLAFVIKYLPSHQPDQTIERKGPRIDAPEQAIAGFFKSCGLSADEGAKICQQQETPKGKVWLYVKTEKGRAVIDMVEELINHMIVRMVWPKSMRFASENLKWVRPLTGCLVVFDGQAVKGSLDIGGRSLPFSNQTFGHRFLEPKEITVKDFADYDKQLMQACVMLDHKDRKAFILNELEEKATEAGYLVHDNPKLLHEVAGLIEWPVVLVGHFDQSFLVVPHEILIQTMQDNQKYFTLTDTEGRLAPAFALVSNMVTQDGGTAIIQGNERVLKARLSDASFFWQKDCDLIDAGKSAEWKGFDRWLEKLEAVTFHEKIGSVGARARDLAHHAGLIAEAIGCNQAEIQKATIAGRLCKADLVSETVFEFPDVQGIAGGYFALQAGYDSVIADAMTQHYLPQGPSDPVPDGLIPSAVALAEKFDILWKFWSIDEKPTGSKDPFALRRAGLGIIRILLEKEYRLDLRAHINQFLKNQEIADHLIGFMLDRLVVHMRGQGLNHDIINAITALYVHNNSLDVVMITKQVEALSQFIGSPDGGNLLTAYRRAHNILRAEQKTNKAEDLQSIIEVDVEIFEQSVEKKLNHTIDQLDILISEAIIQEDFIGAMAKLSQLRVPMDDFFDAVMVNVDDQRIKTNRLALLHKALMLSQTCAIFSHIEG